MKITADTNSPAEENCSRLNFGKNLLLPSDKQGAVLKTSSSFTCSSNLSRSYVEQVSSVTWYRTKCRGRPRSNSYPFIKRWNPLPRVIEEDESVEETPKGTHCCVSNVHVQTINWADNKLSEEWLTKINLLRSTLVEAPGPKVKRRRPRSNSFPFIKLLHPLPCVTEEDETTEDENTTQLQQIQKDNRTDRLSHDLLDKISTVSLTLSTTDKPQGPYQHVNYPLAKFTRSENPMGLENSRQGASASFKRASINRTGKAVDQDSNNRASLEIESSPIRKPDSAYISLISGFTHETIKQANAQHGAKDSDTSEPITSDCKQIKEKNCKTLKCITFSPRKLLCSTARQDIKLQLCGSSEYIPQM